MGEIRQCDTASVFHTTNATAQITNIYEKYIWKLTFACTFIYVDTIEM